MEAPSIDPSGRSWTSKVERMQASLPSTLAKTKDSYTIVGSMSGKVTLGRTLKLSLLCGVVKRKGLGVGRREVTRRQSKDQGFRLGAKDWAKVREEKCLFTRGMNGKHILIEIRCLKSGQLPKGSW